MATIALPRLGIGAAFALLVGCSNVVTAVERSVTVVCSVHSAAGEASCLASRNFPSSAETSLENECANSGGTIVDSCPTAALVGCCTQVESTFSTESCFYTGTVSELRSECGTGTWSTSP
jgi:hypothetical protein